MGWKGMPLSLKIVFVLLALWAIGSVFAIGQRYDLGLPFFGVFVYGLFASLIVLILDIISPLMLMFGLWNAKKWSIRFASLYIGIFVLNSIFAAFTFKEELGLAAIIMPALVNLIILGVLISKKKHFK